LLFASRFYKATQTVLHAMVAGRLTAIVGPADLLCLLTMLLPSFLLLTGVLPFW
jgi:hypothetical protein